ncbi:hypothetical protein J7K42_01400 [bacterium]|nr:hypothetical protein [bacterium]
MNKTKKILPLFIIGCFCLVGVIIAVSYIYFQKGKEISLQEQRQEQKPSSGWVGEYTFNVASASGVYPKFISGKFSKRPKDVKGGEPLTASIKVEDPEGISEVKLVIIGQEESLEQEITLELIDGDQFSGVWQGDLTVLEGITKISWTNFFVKNKLGKKDNLNLKW